MDILTQPGSTRDRVRAAPTICNTRRGVERPREAVVLEEPPILVPGRVLEAEGLGTGANLETVSTAEGATVIQSRPVLPVTRIGEILTRDWRCTSRDRRMGNDRPLAPGAPWRHQRRYLEDKKRFEGNWGGLFLRDKITHKALEQGLETWYGTQHRELTPHSIEEITAGLRALPGVLMDEGPKPELEMNRSNFVMLQLVTFLEHDSACNRITKETCQRAFISLGYEFENWADEFLPMLKQGMETVRMLFWDLLRLLDDTEDARKGFLRATEAVEESRPQQELNAISDSILHALQNPPPGMGAAVVAVAAVMRQGEIDTALGALDFCRQTRTTGI